MSSLAQILFDAPFERLKLVASLWGIEVSSDDPRIVASILYREICSPWVFRNVFRRLSPEEQTVLNTLSQRSRGLRVDRLARETQLDSDTLRSSIGTLRRMGMLSLRRAESKPSHVIEDKSNVGEKIAATQLWTVALYTEISGLHRAMRKQISQEGTQSGYLRNQLSQMDISSLQGLARDWGIERPHESRKDDLISLLLEMMRNKKQLRLILDICSVEAQMCFQKLIEAGGSIVLDGTIAWLEGKSVTKYLEELVTKLLVADVYSEGRWVLSIPQEILGALTSDQQIENTNSPRRLGSPVQTESNGLFFYWSIIGIVNYFQRNRLVLTFYEKNLPRNVTEKLNSLLPQGRKAFRRIDLDFLLHVSFSLGIVERTQSGVLASGHLSSWAKLDFAGQATMVLEFWKNDRLWEEPDRNPHGLWEIDRCEIRKKVLHYLAESKQEDGWYSLDSLVTAIVYNYPYLLQTVKPTVSNKRRRYNGSQGIDRRTVLESIIGSMITTPMHWLGLIDLGKNSIKETGPSFRITTLGREVFFGEVPDDNYLYRTGHFIVDTDLGIKSVTDFGPAFYQLSRFADLMAIDEKSTFVITQQSILRGLKDNLRIQDMVQFLAENCDGYLPEKAMSEMERLAAGFKRVTISPAILIEVDDERVLQEIISSERFGTQIERVAGPTTAVLKQGVDRYAFFDDLRQNGYYPIVR